MVLCEHAGLARDLRRRVAAEERELAIVFTAAMEPIKDRLRRYPGRSLRPELLTDLARRWRAAPAVFRLSFDVKRDRNACVITEVRLSAGSMERLNDPAWNGMEPTIAIILNEFLAWKEKTKLRERPRALFSLHAIARRLQRDPRCDDAVLISDMALVAKIDVANIGHEEGFVIHTREGGWRGRAVRNKTRDGEVQRLIAVRTWMSSEAVADSA